MSNASAARTSANPLPPVPPLDHKELQLRAVHANGHGGLHALVPSGKNYICKDPNAPALVMVPGLGMDGLGFIRQLPLGAQTDLHLFQTPNEPAPNEEGLGHFASHVEAYIQSARLEHRPGGVILAGCSMGGAVSLCTAIRGRVKLRGLILLGTFGHCRHLHWWQRLFAPAIRIQPLRLGRKVARRVIQHTTYFGKIQPHEADWLVDSKMERTRDYFTRAVMALTRQNQIEAAKKLALPTLVVHGRKDYVLPHAAGEELHAAIPNSRLVTLDASGHALFFTDHDAVNQAMAEFISSL